MAADHASQPGPPANVVVVLAAVIERDNCFLVTKRLSRTHLAGYWEFPGGKCEAGESHEACLRRELDEELGVDARIGDSHVRRTRHPERTVRLHFRWCEFDGEPQPRLGQEMRWVLRSELASLQFPEADRELVEIISRADSGPHR